MSQASAPKTFFASAERAAPGELDSCIEAATNNPVIDAVLSSHGTMVLLLNEQRQIVAVNDAYLRFIGGDNVREVLGLRHGETVSCPHVEEGPGGCGTSRSCKTCGAAIAIVACQKQDAPVERDCVLSTRVAGRPNTLDLRVRAVPLPSSGFPYLVLFLQDISREKRREALEQAFFHDIANVVNGVQGAVHLLDEASEGGEDVLDDLRHLAVRLRREVDIQRALAEEGEGDCQPEWEMVPLSELLASLLHLYRSHPAAKERHIDWPAALPATAIRTDRSLLLRVLANMVTNACEATPEWGTVRVGIETNPGSVIFEVSNPGEIPVDLQGRIFQRYFTTRPGVGRGQGTYAMKLFGERALGGKVSFKTSAADGTTFRLELPTG